MLLKLEKAQCIKSSYDVSKKNVTKDGPKYILL